MNESGLIARSERFLESIKSRPVTLDEIRSREGFFKIYRYLRGNLDELQDLKETMELRASSIPSVQYQVTVHSTPVKLQRTYMTLKGTPSTSG